MAERITFHTRARTIDHLGRGQIADSPTAISELWKNAFDAYARNVSLHIFDGEPRVAAVTDDGFGMARSDFVNRWLVIGTESKLSDRKVPPEEQFGLPERVRQGEKGIGRLSAAFLAPVTLVVSRKLGHPFAAVMVDWRLFENPFLSLDDVSVAVEEFEDPLRLFDLLPQMRATLHENVTGEAGPDARTSRLREGWERFSELEHRGGAEETTAERILGFDYDSPISERHLNEWTAWLHDDPHGTALFLLDVHRELAVWVDPEARSDEAQEARDLLRETLTGFTDPLDRSRTNFEYEVVVHRGGEQSPHRVLDANDVFGPDDFSSLEHLIDGAFDEEGRFTARVKAFGEDLGEQQFVPRQPPPQSARDRVGPFRVIIGTFEREAANTTHTIEEHALLMEKAERFSGIAMYRDGLRVMPYGRTDADWLGIEERRSKHAGREFWAHRRSFGRVAITREENPNLRDKAGREGLVDNRARRVMKLLVVEVLQEFARRYFGTDAEVRKEMLPEIKARNARGARAAEQARVRQRRQFRKFLRTTSKEVGEALEALDEARVALAELQGRIGSADPSSRDALTSVEERINELVRLRERLRPPRPPARLGDYEEDYRRYRDRYSDYLNELEELRRQYSEAAAAVTDGAVVDRVREHLDQNERLLVELIAGFVREVNERLTTLKAHWNEEAAMDRERYKERAEALIVGVSESSDPAVVLRTLDLYYAELEEDLTLKYESAVRSLTQLAEGIELEGAFAVTEEERAELEERVGMLHGVAQLGITVEIIGHELEVLDEEVDRNIALLPKEVRQAPPLMRAYEAHKALAERLRFLAPMKLSGYRTRQRITGEEIGDYIGDFFERRFREANVDFTVTDVFKSIVVTDLPSRIFPAFINLVNNALYWVNFVDDRRLTFDFVDGEAVVADSGAGVDPDDVPRLFDLFFTRRAQGRGVGLYLVRSNLAVAGHTIRYARKDDPHVLPGANFIIEFKGVTTAEPSVAD